MNIFRFIADLLHLLSFLVLINRIRSCKNCLGRFYIIISIKYTIFIITLGISYKT